MGTFNEPQSAFPFHQRRAALNVLILWRLKGEGVGWGGRPFASEGKDSQEAGGARSGGAPPRETRGAASGRAELQHLACDAHLLAGLSRGAGLWGVGIGGGVLGRLGSPAGNVPRSTPLVSVQPCNVMPPQEPSQPKQKCQKKCQLCRPPSVGLLLCTPRPSPGASLLSSACCAGLPGL